MKFKFKYQRKKTMINELQTKNTLPDLKRQFLLKIVKITGIVIGAVVFTCVLIFLFFPDPFINSFLKDRITGAFTKSYPEYSIQLGDLHYNVWKNRLACDSITLKSNEYTFNVALFSFRGINWMKVLWRRDYSPDILKNSVIDAQKIILDIHQSQNELRLGRLHISVPDSELTADSIKYYPLLDDKQFFAKSKFRRTRFRFDTPQLNIMGLDFPALLQGNIYNAKNININDMFADILVSMDKPYDKNSPNPQMPNEFLLSIKEIVKIDSLKIINGRLKYCERFAVNAEPGMINFNKANISISGIANHTTKPDTAVILGEGLFMNAGKMKLSMAILLSSTDFSLRYSGSVSSMDATRLNSFIEPGEHHRIKSGMLQSAMFNINVNSGHSTGSLRMAYKDLSIAVINKDTGSEKGIFDRIASLFGKLFVIRGTNMPDAKGAMKIGQTKYKRNPDDYFFQFVWFALRNGVADVVGFPPI